MKTQATFFDNAVGMNSEYVKMFNVIFGAGGLRFSNPVLIDAREKIRSTIGRVPDSIVVPDGVVRQLRAVPYRRRMIQGFKKKKADRRRGRGRK